MNLYLVRHAEAAPVGGAIAFDRDRTLTTRGEGDAALMGRALARLDPDVRRVLTSPLIRAVRTGEIIMKEFPGRPELETTENLAPGFRPGDLFDELDHLDPVGSVIAVGHQPDLSSFICFMIADSSRAAIAMAACAAAKVTVEKGGGRCEATLRWLLTPEAVRSMFPSL